VWSPIEPTILKGLCGQQLELQELEVQVHRLILLTVVVFSLQVDGPMFRPGDVVSVMEDRAEVCKLQKGHGEWSEEMTAVRNNLQKFVSQEIFIAILTSACIYAEPNIHKVVSNLENWRVFIFVPPHAVTWPTWTSGVGGSQCSTGCAGLSGWEEVDLQLCLPETCSRGEPHLLRP